MAAACKALPRCTRAYSAVIDRQATLSYECVDSRNRAAACCMHAHIACVGQALHRPAVSSHYHWRTEFLVRHSIEDPWQGYWTATSHFELRARCSAPTNKHARRRCPLNRKG